MTMTPGDRVLYTLDETDAKHVNQWRENFGTFNHGASGHKHPHDPGTAEGERLSSGHMAHVGNPVHAGDQLAADVCAVPDMRRLNAERLNLRVLLDGCDVLWVSCVPESDRPGTWQRRPG